MTAASILALTLIFIYFIDSEAVYFAHRKPELCLHIPSTTGTIVGRVYAYPRANEECGISADHPDAIMYDVVGDNSLFAINSTGFIYLKESLPQNATGPVSFEVSASCKDKDDVVVSSVTMVTVNFHETEEDSQLATNQIVPDQLTIERICFSHLSADSTFVVEENVKDIVIGRLNTCWQDLKYERNYRIEKPKSRFSIDPITSEVTLIKQLDRESLGDNKGQPDSISGIQPLKITCEVKIDDVIYPSNRHRINITVLDVNDNPPRFHHHNGLQHISKYVEIQNGTKPQSLDIIEEIVEDMDAESDTISNHVVKTITDELNVCKTNLHCVRPQLAKLVCRLRIHLENIDYITDTLYKCEIAVVDENMIQSDSKMNNSATVVINIHKPLDDSPPSMSFKSTLALSFFRNATRLARLHTINGAGEISTKYTLRDEIFGITPRSGIIYVENTAALAAAPSRHSMTVVVHDGPNIAIDVALQGSGRNSISCDEGCSVHDSTQSCSGACGVGLTSGGCVMRGSERNPRMSKNYGTCTHEIATCPNLVCDELENRFPHLCPQDCTTEVSGAYLLGNPRGIMMAESPCWCEEDNGIYCTCMPPHEPKPGFNVNTTVKNGLEAPDPVQSDRPSVATSKISTENDMRYDFEKTPKSIIPQSVTQIENETYHTDTIALVTDQPPICDKVCGVAIGVGITMFFLITFSLFMLWFTKKKNDRRKTNMKHVGSVVSISGLPSDYQDERERRLSYSSDHWSQKGPIYSTQIQYMYEDSERWEIPRDSLTLEKTLGEGEFGLVVKARMTSEDQGVRNVAVKMLKHCSTQLEEQDLWSEYNLLKDVSHPNVVRLVGACTVDGPFYLVVEFCQHGCLLKYLRRSRLEENGYVNSAVRLKSPNVKEQTDPELNGDLLSMRDLLSFAWQIAKGMSYLSEIKLVHRDLAARNILVASGKVLKISDFGLTRDVYEADTYLKKSKGRIPVKWLAPESLYAQIYTTRSDIWSYGIVLWELVTLGAPPYPGIPPERLYNLLIGGYRMDRPENCQDEMYAVMQKCWKIDAADRPSFATLAKIFDRILQEKTGYLDLSQNNIRISDLYNKCFNTNYIEKDEEKEILERGAL
ncbi:proto-oncogene tyrosine-protein kinase receptor Ret-like [Ruditapes philippinarum]|uniref:proto-oncogene tyrosine-protein kinase receptor Ret-like n=1 Tax=Ruditapes philippinarum TaxID=129788 RepID=UPI00295C0E0E|nr:proto-oncogene tyrosine-protein kinase receptor Ret-like [Ruditapes philippinarum]